MEWIKAENGNWPHDEAIVIYWEDGRYTLIEPDTSDKVSLAFHKWDGHNATHWATLTPPKEK